MAKDPICGMFVDESTAELKAEVRGVTYYFCSESCMREFLSPEKELRKLKIELLASTLLSLPILLFTYASLLPARPSDYVLFALDTPLQFVIGWRFYEGTYDSIKNRMGNMDVLIALGTSAAWAYSAAVTFAPELLPSSGVYFDTSAIIITLILAGRFLEHVTRSRASAALRKLVELQPPLAHRIEGDLEVDVPVERIKVGDLLVVRPGERIPVDAVIVEGRSAIDESMMTGEGIPAERSVGDVVIGATINRSGLLKLRADKVGQDTTLSQIVRLVEEAQIGKAPIQRLADRIASYFVPVVVAAATLAALSWYYLGHIGPAFSVLVFVSVVVISCPCALGVATPAALLVGTSKGAQSGILIKGGEYLELAARVDVVVFDKTGTLTMGKPSVTDVVTNGIIAPEELLHLAASAEKGSEHPLGEALVDEAASRSIVLSDPRGFEAMGGMGVRAMVDGRAVMLGNRRLMQENGIEDLSTVETDVTRLEEEGKTTMIVVAEGIVVGIIAVADTVKPTAKPAVDALGRMGIRVVMLTGDSPRTAMAIAQKIGITEFVAGLLPREKEEKIGSLQSQGKVVAMVGDGINDAPALAKADIGIAIGSGTDIARETGQIVLIKDDLQNVAVAIQLSRKTLSKIKENLFWAFAYNVVLIPVAAGALVPILGVQVYNVLPFLAAGAMAISSVTVIGNSLLLFRFRPSPV
ncbi:MAG: heavy metal translocating P-type ATPase [Thaumarchaeota archaeon]|nr:heavy metal translocating P-type ATPase [Nitrososphaerota archaeon]